MKTKHPELPIIADGKTKTGENRDLASFGRVVLQLEFSNDFTDVLEYTGPCSIGQIGDLMIGDDKTKEQIDHDNEIVKQIFFSGHLKSYNASGIKLSKDDAVHCIGLIPFLLIKSAGEKYR